MSLILVWCLVMRKQNNKSVSRQVSAHLLEQGMKQATLSPNLSINSYLLHRDHGLKTILPTSPHSAYPETHTDTPNFLTRTKYKKVSKTLVWLIRTWT